MTFGPQDAGELYFPQQDPLVIFANIMDFKVKHIHVDRVSSVNLLFVEAFDKMMITETTCPLRAHR